MGNFLMKSLGVNFVTRAEFGKIILKGGILEYRLFMKKDKFAHGKNL
jgi:hypothetical protein